MNGQIGWIELYGEPGGIGEVLRGGVRMAHPTRRLRGDCKKVQERTPISGEIGSLATFSDPSEIVLGLFEQVTGERSSPTT
jgi:hypothetical protein